MGKIAVVAVGGNSLIKDEKHKSVPDQFDAGYETSGHIVSMIEKGYNVVITHGNGPQVGFILRRSELAAHELHEVPLDYCGADTQGALGYVFQRSLVNIFKDRGINKKVATVVTMVVVDKNDKAFQTPSKPIGSFMSEAEAKRRKETMHWDVMEDAGRGWRRVVASPDPKDIIEIDAIISLVKDGYVVICAGGGGIPVIWDETGHLQGVEAVIDKDYASSLLATMINADLFVISTAVAQVYRNYGKPDQAAITLVDVVDMKKYIDEGHFKPGSMLPKIEVAIRFLENGGKKVIITCPRKLAAAVDGEAGTHIYKWVPAFA